MKYKLLVILNFLVLAACTGASPIASSITYQNISPNKYKIIYKGVRDCRATPFNASGLTISCDSGSRNVSMIRTSIRNITLNVPGACNPQNNSGSIGSEEHTYEYILDLDTIAGGKFKTTCKFIFSTQVCCRNGSITTLFPGNMYYECMLDRCLAGDNSGPVFFNTKNIYARINQANYYNPIVIDTIDGDMLIYELYTPMQTNNSYTAFHSGYSRDYPLSPLCSQVGQKNCNVLPLSRPPRGLYIDSLNGNLIYTPTNSSEVSVICYKVREYRMINGSRRLIGYYITDHFWVASNNGNNEPMLTKSTMKLEHRVKSGQKIRITFATEQNDTMKNDSVRMFITNSIKGSVDSVFSSWRSYGSFEWTPGCKDISKYPHFFIVSFYSEKTWVYDFQSIAVNIYVESELNIGPDTNICINDSFLISSNLAGKYMWNGIASDSSQNFVTYNAGKYWLDLTRNGCTVSDTIHLKELSVLPNPRLGNDTIICNQAANSPITLFTPYEQYVRYSWNVNPSNKTSVLVYNGEGTVIIKGENVCGESFDSIQINRLNTPDITLPADTHLCHPFTITIKAKENHKSYQWEWSTNDKDSAVSVSNEGLYWAIAKNVCGTDADSINIIVSEKPVLDLGNDTFVCNGNYPLLNAFFPKCEYLWSDKSTNPVLQVSDSGIYSVSISNFCGFIKDSIRVKSMYTPDIYLGADSIICSPVNFNLKAAFPYSSIIWNTGVNTEVINIQNGGTYYVNVFNKCGYNTDSIHITEKQKPVVNLGRDTGLKKPFALLLNGPEGESRYSWNNSESDTLPQLYVSEFGLYWLRVDNQCGFSTDSIMVSDLSEISTKHILECTVFPNPSNGIIKIQSENEITSIELYDLSGKACYISRVIENQNQAVVNTEQVEDGFYYLLINGINGSKRILIQIIR